MTWTMYHSFGLFATVIALLFIITTFRLLFQRRKAGPAHPAHNRIQQFLGRLGPRHPHPAPQNSNAASEHDAVGLQDDIDWNAAILVQNDEAAIRGLREDCGHPSLSLNASVHERDLAYEDGTVLAPPPPPYSPIARASGAASALSPLSAPAPRSITSSISTTTTTITTVQPPVEHIGGGIQPMLGTQTSTMPSQRFTTRSGNRYDLSSFAAGMPGLQIPTIDAAKVAQRLDQLKRVFKPLVAYEELASRAEGRQGRGVAATAGAGAVSHADFNPVPNPRYYRVDPPQDLEKRIRAANANTLPGITILGELRAHQNDTPPSAPPAHQNGIPPRIRTPGTPRPMVFGHRPVLRGPMPSQAAIFADDENNDENGQNDAPAYGSQHFRTRTPGIARLMDSGGSSSTAASITSHQAQQASPRIRTPGTPRPMVFGTRPVFCGRMPSQAATVESDHEDDDDSDATLRVGALHNYVTDFEDEVEQSLRGGSLSSQDFYFDDENKNEILVVVHEVLESSGHHTDDHLITVDAHEISSVGCGVDARASDDAKSEVSSGVSNDELNRRISANDNDLEAEWAWVPRPFISGSMNENAEATWVGSHIVSCRNSNSDGMAREYQLLNEYVASEAEKMASVCSIYSTDANFERDWTGAVTAEEDFFVRLGHNKAIKTEKWMTVSNLAKRKVSNRERKVRRARKLLKMRREMAEIFDFDGTLDVEAGEESRPFFEHEEGILRCGGQPPIWKPGQTGMDRIERVRGGWLPNTAEYDIKSPARMTWEEELSGAFKHNPYPDTRHWQCQSYSSACVACRAQPATQPPDNRPELTLEDLDRLPRRHMWRFELHRAFQAVKEALIHTAVEEFLDTYETEHNAPLNGTEAEQKAFTSEFGTTMRGGYLSYLGVDVDENDEKDVTPVSAPVKAILRAFKLIEEAMITTAQLDFKMMLWCPVYPVRGDVWEKLGFEEMKKMGSLERVMMAWEMLDRESFERMGETMMATAVLDGRARKLAEMVRRLGEGLRGGALEGFDDTDMEEFSEEELMVEHREYADRILPDSRGHHATHDSSSGRESGSELSRVSSRLSWLGNWGFVIPAWQPRFSRSGKERLRRLSEARRVLKLKPTLWDEFPHRSQDEISQLPLPFSTDTSLRCDGITPSPLSFRTSTSLRSDGITQRPLEEDLPYPEYPWKPSDLSSESSLRGGASGFLGLETDLPYPEFPWEPSNLATAASSTALRGGGNALSEVSEAAQDVAYALARPHKLYELAIRPKGFDPYACERIRGPNEIRAIQKHNRRARARASALRKSRYLRRKACCWPTPTHHDPDFVYKWKEVAWNRPNTIFVPFNRRNRYTRGVSRASMWGGKYFWDGTTMRYAQGNCRKPSQKVVRQSGWTRGVRRRGGIFGEELVGSLSGLRGAEFARSGICGSDGGLSSGVSGSLRGGQLTNEDGKDQMEGLESHNDAREYQLQCPGQNAATTSPSNETTKLTSNASSDLPAPSPLSFLNQAFVPSPSPTVESLYKASLSHRKHTGLGKTMTWLALNNHHKKCRPGMCATPCRAIVTLPFKPPQIKPVSMLESINAIAYWFGDEAEALCNPSSGALRGGFLMDEKEEGREDGEEIEWRSPNSLRDGEPDPLAHLLMRRQCFFYRRVEVPTEEIHADLGEHNYDCQPGRCSLFCRARVALPATDMKTETPGNPDPMLSCVKNVSPKQTGHSDASSDSEVHPYSQRIAELNKILGLTVRTDFRNGYCVEGHTHPEGMGVYTESDASRKSFRRLKGKRPGQPAQRLIPPLLSPLPIKENSHWWIGEFFSQVHKRQMSPPATHENESLRGGGLDEAFKMPRSGVNGWLFDRSTNWTFRRTRATSMGDQDESRGTDTNLHAGYKEPQLPDSPPLTPVDAHEAEKLAMAFEKMSFVSGELSLPSSRRNGLVSFEGPVSLGYASNGKFDPYLCWPDWAYKLYDPPRSPYDSPKCDTTGRWRRPVSRHLLAGILGTLPETTGMFRRLEDGTIVRIGLQEMTAEERETMLEYAKGKKRLRRNSWGLFPCLEARLVVEEADELKGLKDGLRGGVLEYYQRRPLAVHFDGDVRWSFGCCGCRPMTPDSPVLESGPYDTTTAYQSDTDSRQTEDATIIPPTQSPFVDEHRSKWYSRPVDATKLKDRLSGLLQSTPKSKRFKDKRGDMVSIGVPTERTGDHRASPLKPSEVPVSKIDSHKTRALKSKRTGVWEALRCGGLRGGGSHEDEDEEMEVDYPLPPTSDDEDEDEGHVYAPLSSPPDSNSGDEWEEVWEYSEHDVLDEQEMDYELSVDLLPLEDAYTDLRERLREEHQEAIEVVDQSRREFQEEGLRPKRRAKLRPAGHKTRTLTGARVGADNESESDEDFDYDPDVENVAPIVYDVDTRKLPSRITSIYDADMEDFPPLPSSCEDLPETSTHETNNSSPTYSPDVSTRASSISSADFPSKGMWVMVHPRVTQLLVAGTCRYKRKHLEKNSGLMRLHDEWAQGTPSLMRLITSVSAFRGELRREKAWENGERKRLDSIEKFQGILANLGRSIVEAEDEEDQEVLDEKDTMEVLVTEVSSDSEDDTPSHSPSSRVRIRKKRRKIPKPTRRPSRKPVTIP